MDFDNATVAGVAKAICEACDENPESPGDARGNECRWQDYLPAAEAAIAAAADGGALIRLHRPEGYEEAHPQLIAEDAIQSNWTWFDVIGAVAKEGVAR